MTGHAKRKVKPCLSQWENLLEPTSFQLEVGAPDSTPVPADCFAVGEPWTVIQPFRLVEIRHANAETPALAKEVLAALKQEACRTAEQTLLHALDYNGAVLLCTSGLLHASDVAEAIMLEASETGSTGGGDTGGHDQPLLIKSLKEASCQVGCCACSCCQSALGYNWT